MENNVPSTIVGAIVDLSRYAVAMMQELSHGIWLMPRYEDAFRLLLLLMMMSGQCSWKTETCIWSLMRHEVQVWMIVLFILLLRCWRLCEGYLAALVDWPGGLSLHSWRISHRHSSCMFILTLILLLACRRKGVHWHCTRIPHIFFLQSLFRYPSVRRRIGSLGHIWRIRHVGVLRSEVRTLMVLQMLRSSSTRCIRVCSGELCMYRWTGSH